MGLCKCERRKVTNLFCFEHRVNVCDHCAATNHKRCIIKSYLHWLQDSDYSPACLLCKESMLDESTGECVRLLCYDVFHWHCLDKWAASMPPNTAPAGFTCPICNSGIFPSSNDQSPVAVCLRSLLSTVSWSRAGLGLPILMHDTQRDISSEDVKQDGDNSGETTASRRKSSFVEVPASPKPRPPEPSPVAIESSESSPAAFEIHAPRPEDEPREQASRQPLLLAGYNNNDGLRSTTGFGATSFSSNNGDGQEGAYARKAPFRHDSDESSNKYKRRSPMLMLARWLSFGASGVLTPHELTLRRRRRFYMLVLLAAVGLFTLIYFGILYGRSVADSDPLLDPRANPHIRIKQHGLGEEAVASLESRNSAVY